MSQKWADIKGAKLSPEKVKEIEDRAATEAIAIDAGPQSRCAHCSKPRSDGWVAEHARATYETKLGQQILCSPECERAWIDARAAKPKEP